MKVLGIDVGNAKVKLCWVNYQGNWEESPLHWDSLPIAHTANRRQDFQLSLPMKILDFFEQHTLVLSEVEQVVVCCSHSLSYQPFSASVLHLAEVLERLFGDKVWLVRADGQLTQARACAQLASEELYAYTFSNFYGSALLGSRLIDNGLALDLGTTTLDVIPIVKGQIDPAGLSDPANYLRFRYQHKRINWLGLTAVPLAMLADQVPLGEHTYQIVPRHYRTDLLLALHPELQQGDQTGLLSQHAYGQDFPTAEKARQELAQFVGLDDYLLSSDEIAAIRDYLWEQLLTRQAAAIREVAESCFGSISGLPLATFALGESLVLRPALLRAGADPAQIRRLELKREQHLWSASSAFAMALLALEAQLGQQIALD